MVAQSLAQFLAKANEIRTTFTAWMIQQLTDEVNNEYLSREDVWRLIRGCPIETLPQQTEKKVWRIFPENFDTEFEISVMLMMQRTTMADWLRRLMLADGWQPKDIIITINKLYLELARGYYKWRLTGKRMKLSKREYPTTWFAMCMRVLDNNTESTFSVQVEYLPPKNNINPPTNYNNLANSNLKINCFIHKIKIIKLRYFWRRIKTIIYKSMQNDNDDSQDNAINIENELKTKGLDEYKNEIKFKTGKVTGTTVQEVLKEKLNLVEAAKSKSYCRRCYDIAHVDPNFCSRKCTYCFGSHWRQQCEAFNRCNWCGNVRGPHKCTDNTLGKLLITCPICLFPGHTADKCKPMFVAVSYLVGPLSRKIKRKVGKRRRFKRFRRWRRRRRRTRK